MSKRTRTRPGHRNPTTARRRRQSRVTLRQLARDAIRGKSQAAPEKPAPPWARDLIHSVVGRNFPSEARARGWGAGSMHWDGIAGSVCMEVRCRRADKVIGARNHFTEAEVLHGVLDIQNYISRWLDRVSAERDGISR